MPKSEAREQVLQAAEALFIQRGYEAVTMKDIAKAAGIHHASIYHHVPGGKTDLFVEVVTRHLHQHQRGIQAALASVGPNLRDQLIAIANWLLSQPPMDLMRLNRSDLPAIDQKSAHELEDLAYITLMIPLEQVLEQAKQRGDIEHPYLGIMAGSLLASIEALHMVPDSYILQSRQYMAEQVIDVFIQGLIRS